MKGIVNAIPPAAEFYLLVLIAGGLLHSNWLQWVGIIGVGLCGFIGLLMAASLLFGGERR